MCLEPCSYPCPPRSPRSPRSPSRCRPSRGGVVSGDGRDSDRDHDV